MAYLDDMVLKALSKKLFAPDRLAELLTIVAARRSERAEAHNAGLVALQVETDNAKERLQRLYALMEEGLAEMDDLLRERIGVLKADREKAEAALDRHAGKPVARQRSTPKRSRPFPSSCATFLGTPTIPRGRLTFVPCSTWKSVPKRFRLRATAKRFMQRPTPPILQGK